ncbi:UDP-3-O-(3-hydroxymyristoyl)glucosamine N-acyltransferase [Maritalea mediterranea]|uniref:UDP-3-O-(3-hydroxymyristoyl)glucosamine N-acyltransferase n=1 Tax=Maritalea mediterranea TaxID=2909667 RepID=A0ABS9E6R7_9HYPH|nr:UDP-3-O-(3-hydroxymyristoyl)glucosamine N-acyltransferase [Maritalea mediterranea]MCF4098556.1 UDP-3-O-(3-hydroxymyristoyl)glucosamine N-acyltransferase [Maritalea mediterranea]
MVDPRFYTIKPEVTLGSALSALDQEDVAATLSSNDLERPLAGAGTVPFLHANELGFVAEKRYLTQIADCTDGIILVPEGADLPTTASPRCVLVRCADPYFLFTHLANYLYRDGLRLLGYCADTSPARLGTGVHFSPNVYFGADVEIGDHVVIGPNCSIGRGVTIGHNATIGDNVSIHCAHIGDGVVIHSGARIGVEGFGFLPRPSGPEKIPQLGRVILQNGVEIGANSCVDRGTLDDTIVGENTKIDNLVQIGHNTKIGRNCQIAAKSGFAGSSEIGDNVLFGGRASIVNKAKLGDRCVVMACSIVTKSQKADSVLAGNPAVELKKWRRMQAKLKMMGRE